LTFVEPSDYDKISPDDRITLYVNNISPGKPVLMKVKKSDGSSFDVKLEHTFNDLQIEWFKAGSALNRMADVAKSSAVRQ